MILPSEFIEFPVGITSPESDTNTGLERFFLAGVFVSLADSDEQNTSNARQMIEFWNNFILQKFGGSKLVYDPSNSRN
jgi:hypothetical protein